MSAKTNLFVDSVILVGFLVAFEPLLTGIAIHEWLSLALAATLMVHLVLHWEWVLNVAARFLRKWFHESRLNFIVDTALFIAFVLVMLSGILISRSILGLLGIQLAASPAWRTLHSLSADASLYLTGLHFALHWKWIASTINRFVVAPLGRLFQPRPLLSDPLAAVEEK